MYVYTYTYIYRYVYIRKQIAASHVVYVYVCLPVTMQVHVHIYIYTHMRTNMDHYTHACMHKKAQHEYVQMCMRAVCCVLGIEVYFNFITCMCTYTCMRTHVCVCSVLLRVVNCVLRAARLTLFYFRHFGGLHTGQHFRHFLVRPSSVPTVPLQCALRMSKCA